MSDFVAALRRVNAGNVIDDASAKLAELVQTVDSTGKPGSVTITISVRKAAAGAMALKGKVTTKLPATPEVETLMFPTIDGDLLTEDPSQRKLDLKPVDEVSSRVLKSVG